MNPQLRYQKDLDESLISEDEDQRRMVSHLQNLFEKLVTEEAIKPGIHARVWRWFGAEERRNVGTRGIYLWGGVGRGKTYLMDLFYDCLPFERKLRTHFHRFMQRVQQDLVRYQGASNPLELVADRIAAEALVVCLDEFFVLDIADAMILSGLFKALFERQIVLVTTSNTHPDRLYENGLQRQRFLPAIALIKHHTRVIELLPGTDYRLRNLSQATLYHCPIIDETEALLSQSFYALAPDKSEIHEREQIEILGRKVQTHFCAEDVVWFDFPQLCDGPRSTFDYVEIAKLYHALLLSDVPQLGADRDDQARRFVSLVDALYDRRVKLIIAAEVPIQALYTGKNLAFAFQRTRSRLVEMQSHDYLGREHLG
ncbi:MAG: AFG1 family ATPase [Proteobacteria bacterium]|nr:AFG1 family ATPase [Pseudomonadota bacterium]